jgi:hypothetical protein
MSTQEKNSGEKAEGRIELLQGAPATNMMDTSGEFQMSAKAQ